MNMDELRALTPEGNGPEDVLKALAPLGEPVIQASLQTQIAALEAKLAALKKKVPRTADGVEFSLGGMLYWTAWNENDYVFKALETRITTHELLYMPTTGPGRSWQVYPRGSEALRGIEVAQCYATASARANALIAKLEGQRERLLHQIDTLKGGT